MTMFERVEVRRRIQDEQGGTCYFCSRTVCEYPMHTRPHPDDMATLDHVLPRSRGGDDRRENLIVSCYRCNADRQNSIPSDYGATLQRGVRYWAGHCHDGRNAVAIAVSVISLRRKLEHLRRTLPHNVPWRSDPLDERRKVAARIDELLAKLKPYLIQRRKRAPFYVEGHLFRVNDEGRVYFYPDRRLRRFIQECLWAGPREEQESRIA